MDVNKAVLRMNLLDAIKLGIKRHFKSARFLEELPELGLVRVQLLGCTFDIHVIDVSDEKKDE